MHARAASARLEEIQVFGGPVRGLINVLLHPCYPAVHGILSHRKGTSWVPQGERRPRMHSCPTLSCPHHRVLASLFHPMAACAVLPWAVSGA